MGKGALAAVPTIFVWRQQWRARYGFAHPTNSPQKHELRIVIGPPLQLLETFGRGERRGFRFFHHEQRAWRQPAAIAQRGQRFFRKPLAVGRIEEGQRERLHRMRGAEIGGVAAIDFCHAAEAERLDIVAQQRAGLRAIVDEQRERSPARSGLDAERAGAGEQVEHARAFDRIVIGVDENIEHRLAQAVRGGADLARCGRGQIATLQPSADDTHHNSREGGVVRGTVRPLSPGERGRRGYP